MDKNDVSREVEELEDRLKFLEKTGKLFFTEHNSPNEIAHLIINIWGYSKRPAKNELVELDAKNVFEFLDKYPIKSQLCFDGNFHECNDLAEAICAKFGKPSGVTEK